MGKIAFENLRNVSEAVLNYDKEKVESVYKTEKTINTMEKLITEYLVQISNLSLNEEQHNIINNLFYSVSDIERVGDHTENIAELLDTKDGKMIQFTEEATGEMSEIMGLVINAFDFAIKAREEKIFMQQPRLENMKIW